MRKVKKRVRNNRSARILLAVVAWMSLTSVAAAQFTPTAHDARSGAMGGVFVYTPGVRTVAVGWRQGYMMTALADKQLCLQTPVGERGAARVDYSHRGNLDYHEQQLAVGGALRVNDWMNVGVDARWLHLGTSDAHYRPQQWLAAEAQVQLIAGRTTWTLQGGTRPWDAERRWRWRVNMWYIPLPRVFAVAAEVESEEEVRLRTGLEYCYEGRFFVRTGMATRPMVFTCGLGARWKNYSFDLAAEVHSSLGITPHLTMTLWL